MLIYRSHVDTSQVIRCIELVMEKNHAKLTRLFKTGSLKSVADELLEAGIITRDVQTNPTSDNIINCFLSGFVFKNELEEIEEYCMKFFNAFYEIRVHMSTQLTRSRNLCKRQSDINLEFS